MSKAHAPMRDEWEIVVANPPDQFRGRIMHMVGPGEADARGNKIILSGFYDDDEAKHVARSITKYYGAIAYAQPRGRLAAEESYEEQGFTSDVAEDRPALRWTEVVFDLKSDASRFSKLLEKRGRGVTASLEGHVVTTNATWNDIQRVLYGNEWEKSYTVAPSAKKYDLAAEKVAEENCAHKHPPEVPSEPCPGDVSALGPNGEPAHPPWLQCTGSPELYKQWIDFGDKFGPIKTTRELYKLLSPRMQSTDQEIFVVVVMDLHAHVRGIFEVNRGERSGVGVSITQVMRAAMIQGGTAFICAHNHPSGKCRPSDADRTLTRTIQKAAKPHGDELKFIDHVVIGHGEYFSIVENKLHKVA